MLDIKFKLKDIGIEYLELELSYTEAHRIFNRGNKRFEYNGRFCGPVYQSFPRDLRKYIRINGEPVVEPDFSAFHIRLLYHLKNIDYRDDPYKVCGEESLRSVFKQGFLISINAETESDAKKALSNKIAEKNLPRPQVEKPMQWIIDRIKSNHKEIAQEICADKGVELMRIDSEIMNNILMRLMDEGIPGLSVHDSVVVPEKHADTLYQIMEEEYEKVMGFKPVID
jgi:hypothetical protein